MRRLPDLPPPEFIPKDRWYTLLPKRSLGKIVALLILLAVVVYFRGRAGSLVRLVGKTAAPVPTTSSPPHTHGSSMPNSVPSSPP